MRTLTGLVEYASFVSLSTPKYMSIISPLINTLALFDVALLSADAPLSSSILLSTVGPLSSIRLLETLNLL